MICQEHSELVNHLLETGTGSSSEVFLVEAPLRVCPLGAHVDHQGGVVTGMTVDRHVILAGTPIADTVRVSSRDFEGEVVLPLQGVVPDRAGDWGDYVRAAISVLADRYPLRTGLRAVVRGDLPGAGLSSSAAVLVSYLFALARVNGIDLEREEVSALVQQAENSYIGVASGRLDQSIILFGEEGCLTRVDCSDLSIEQVSGPLNSGDFSVLIAFSGLSRSLAGSGFNSRVEECRRAARALFELQGEEIPESPVLGDVPPEVFVRFGADLPQALRRRAAHYFGEQRRVVNGVEAWRRGDLDRFGALTTSSGASSINNFECGTAELVTLYEVLRNTPGVFGTRFSGGGFGGCCIALIDREAGASIGSTVMRAYEEAHPEAAATASIDICKPGGRARFLDLDL